MDNVKALDIANYDQWLLWTFRDGRKVPLNKWGESSGVNRPWDFMTFDEAVAASEKLTVQGVAFVFMAEDFFYGIDLDNACEVSTYKTLKPWARDIAERANSYSETSPSLTGCKIICRGKLPEGARNRFPCGDGEVEIYQEGRFFTITGVSLDDFPSVVNDFDCSELIAEIAPKIEERPARISVPISGGMDTAERIRGYLAGIMLTPGSRNNTVFSAAGHIKAFVDSDGRGLPEMDLLNLLLEWNAMQSEPITDAEISQTAQSAWRNGTPRELKYPSVEVVDNSDIDLSNIMEPYEIKPSESEVLEFPKLKFRGLVGDITRHIVESALYPQPEFSLFAALSIMSVLTGQKVKDKGGCRTNIMCACVGKSGSGKDWPRVVMQQIFNKIGMDKFFGPQDIGSSAGLMKALEEISSVQVFPLDELGILLGNVNSAGAKSAHLSNIGKAFLELYGSSSRTFVGAAYADVTRTPRIDCPHCVVYGSTTPSTFWGGMTEDNLTSGLTARLLVVEGDYVDPVDDHEEKSIPDDIISRCREWSEYNPTAAGDLEMRSPKVLVLSAGARDRLKEHRRDIALRRKDETDAEAALWSRVAEKSQKLAMLLACGRQSPNGVITIDPTDMDQAIAISNWSCRYLISKFQHIGDTAWGRQVARVAEWIEHEGDVTMTTLAKRFRGIRKRDRVEILQQLQESGKIEVVEVETAGRPRTVIRLIVT